jgi:hypothetical protein
MSSENGLRVARWLLAGAIAANGIAASLHAQYRAWRTGLKSGPGFVDYVSRVDRQLATLQRRLSGRGPVEYVTDAPNERIWQEPLRLMRVGTLQYAIAPTILALTPPEAAPHPDGRPKQRLLLADFRTNGELDAFVASNGCEVRWRRGGLALLWRR